MDGSIYRGFFYTEKKGSRRESSGGQICQLNGRCRKTTRTPGERDRRKGVSFPSGHEESSKGFDFIRQKGFLTVTAIGKRRVRGDYRVSPPSRRKGR